MANSLKSFYYTSILSIFFILLFSISPKLLILQNSLFVKSVEVQNESKTILEKVLSGKNIDDEQDDKLDNLLKN